MIDAASLDELRNRLYREYVSQHADGAARRSGAWSARPPRAAFTRGSCAEAFLKGTEVMLPGETPIRQAFSEPHRSRTE